MKMVYQTPRIDLRCEQCLAAIRARTAAVIKPDSIEWLMNCRYNCTPDTYAAIVTAVRDRARDHVLATGHSVQLSTASVQDLVP